VQGGGLREQSSETGQNEPEWSAWMKILFHVFKNPCSQVSRESGQGSLFPEVNQHTAGRLQDALVTKCEFVPQVASTVCHQASHRMPYGKRPDL